MAYGSSRSSRRRSRRSRRRTGTPAFPWKAVLLGGVCLAVLGGGGFAALQDMSTVKPDDIGCYTAPDGRNFTAVLVDSSDPGFDEVQRRDLITGLSREFTSRLGFNAELALITTQESRIGSIAAPVLRRCGPAKSPADLESIGAGSATQSFVTRQADEVFRKEILPELERIFSTTPADSDRQRYESPVLEQIQSVSRMPGFADAPKRRLILVSDLLQRTREAQFCQTKGHLPRFVRFKEQSYFERVRPQALGGADVTVYMLLRGELGKPPFPYCTEDELRTFWDDFLRDAGAGSVDFIRVRQGAYAAVRQ